MFARGTPRGTTTARGELLEGVAMGAIAIRPANPRDVPAIMELIRALAEYERLSHEVVGGEAQLHEHLFGDRPAAEVLIGQSDGETAGFALFFTSYSTFLTAPGIYLED